MNLLNEDNEDNEESSINSIYSFMQQYLKIDTMIPNDFSKIINPKNDVTFIFFTLVENFAEFFEVSPLPRNINRLFFSSFLSLHHYATNLFQPGASHLDADFTAQWKNFSAVFKMVQSTVLPFDYKRINEQIKMYMKPFSVKNNSSSASQIFLIDSFKGYMASSNQIQDIKITPDAYAKARNDFKVFRSSVKKYSLENKIDPPHLNNAMMLLDYYFTSGYQFLKLKEFAQEIDNKADKYNIITIHKPNTTEIQSEPRLFLIASIKILLIESRMITYKLDSLNLPETGSENISTNNSNSIKTNSNSENNNNNNDNNTNNTNINENDKANNSSSNITNNNNSTTNNNAINGNIGSTSKHSKKTRTLNDILGVLQTLLAAIYIFRDSQLMTIWQKYATQASRLQIVFDRRLEQQSVDALDKEMSVKKCSHHIMVIFEEYKRLFSQAVYDSTGRSLHPLSHCIVLLLKLSTDANDSNLSILAMNVIDCITSRLLISKSRDDQQTMYRVINAWISQANFKANDNFMRTLTALRENLKFVFSTQSTVKMIQKIRNYANYLDLLISVSENGEVPSDLIAYHMDPQYLSVCVSNIYNSVVSDFNLSSGSSTIPPLIFSSYARSSGQISIQDIDRLSDLLMTEKWREHGVQVILMHSLKLNLFMKQVISFAEMATAKGVTLGKFTINEEENQNLIDLFNDMHKLEQQNMLFTEAEQKEFARNLIDLLLTMMYSDPAIKFKSEEVIDRIANTLSVPRCPELLGSCFSNIIYFDNLVDKMPKLENQVKSMKTALLSTFNGSFEQFNSVKKNRKEISDEIMKVQPAIYDESDKKYHAVEKYLVLCHLMFQLGNKFNKYRYMKSLVPILSCVNTVACMSKTVAEGIKLKLFNPADFEKTISDISIVLSSNHFADLDFEELTKTIRDFALIDVSQPLKRLESMCTNWIAWATSIINHSIVYVDSANDFKNIKKLISECIEHPKASKLDRVIAITSKVFVNKEIYEANFVFSITKNFINRVKLVYNLLLLQEYPKCLVPDEVKPTEVNINDFVKDVESIKHAVENLHENSAVLKVKNICNKMKTHQFVQDYSDICKLTPEVIHKDLLSELKGLKRKTQYHIKVFTLYKPLATQKVSLVDQFDRLIHLMNLQINTKDEKINELIQQRDDLKQQILELVNSGTDKESPMMAVRAIEKIVNSEKFVDFYNKEKEELNNYNVNNFDEQICENGQSIQSIHAMIQEERLKNIRLKHKIKSLSYPSYEKPIPTEMFTNALGFNENKMRGGSWIFSNSRDNSSLKEELNKLRIEKNECINKRSDLKIDKKKINPRDYIEKGFEEILNSNYNITNGRMSRMCMTTFLDKSDFFFIHADADILLMSQKLKK